MTILDAAVKLRARKVSSEELTSAALARIAEANPDLNAFMTVLDESARARARHADEEIASGIDRGPLHGVPIALKDLFYTRGVRTTGGSKLFENFVPEFDGAVVEDLDAAGAVLVGKTGLHELAYGITSDNAHFGTIRNPRDRERIPGGSSGGSAAAVACGMVFMAMGSDTGGSIRIPASYCGTVGLKPTYGRVSRFGAFPLGYSLDHMGPLTRSVQDAAVVLDAIAGYDPRDRTTRRRPVFEYLPDTEPAISGIRIGLPQNFYFERIDPQVDAAVRAALSRAESLGAEIVPVTVPDIAALNAVGRILLLCEASAALEPHLGKRDQISPGVRALLDQGRLLPATDYIQAQRLRRLFMQEFQKLWGKIDCLATPTAPITAPKIGDTTVEIGGEQEDVRLATTRFVRGINVLGLPAISIPCGNDDRGLPVGLQLIGKAFDEAGILRVAQALFPDEA